MQRFYSQTFGAVGAILEKDGKILLVKESQWVDAGKWNQPAGWLEVGEHPLEAVRREVHEETGLTFTPTHILGVCSAIRNDLKEKLGGTPHCLKIIFVGTFDVSHKDALADDISEAKWFTPEEIYAMSHEVLRDPDIKDMVRSYFAGKRYPLELLSHSVQN